MSPTTAEDVNRWYCKRQQTMSAVSLAASLLALICTFSIYLEQPTRSELLTLATRIAQVEDRSSATRHTQHTAVISDVLEVNGFETDVETPTSADRLRRDVKSRDSKSKRSTRSNQEKGRRRKNNRATPDPLDSIHFEARLPAHNISTLSTQDKIDMDSARGYLTLAGFHPNAGSYHFWKMYNKSNNAIPSFLHLSDDHDHVTIIKQGKYFVYAQILYHDLSGRWAFGIFVNDNAEARCITSQHLEPDYFQSLPEGHRASHGVYTHCNTATVVHLTVNQRVSIRALYPNRVVIAHAKSSFWGIIKL